MDDIVSCNTCGLEANWRKASGYWIIPDSGDWIFYCKIHTPVDDTSSTGDDKYHQESQQRNVKIAKTQRDSVII